MKGQKLVAQLLFALVIDLVSVVVVVGQRRVPRDLTGLLEQDIVVGALVTALGLDAAKRERDRLSEEAVAALAGFGPEAAMLRAAAEFTAQRKS